MTHVKSEPGTYLDTAEFKTAVAMGRIPGYQTLIKYGINPEITTSTDPEDLWEFGGLYPYDDVGTAPILYTSSSSAADTGQTIVVQGLNIDGEYVSQEIETNGQTVVNLTTPLWRVFRMYNDSTTAVGDVNGTFYCHTDASPTAGVPTAANTRAVIVGNHNQTLMVVYTIPKGKVGLIVGGEVGVQLEGNAAALAEYATFHYEARLYGKIFRVVKSVSTLVAEGNYTDPAYMVRPLPALTDIKLSIQEVSATMGVWGELALYLVDEDQFTAEYLEGIGQPT